MLERPIGSVKLVTVARRHSAREQAKTSRTDQVAHRLADDRAPPPHTASWPGSRSFPLPSNDA